MVNVKEIRDLAKKFSPDQIEECITQQLETGENVCLRDYSTQVVVGELAKAEFIKRLMGEGMSLADALKELARRMRLIHEQFGAEK